MGLLNATVTAIMIVGLASSSPQHLDKLLEPGNLVTHSEQVLDIADEWTKFKRLFLKSFSPEENIKRFNIFQENWKRIDVLKKQFQNGELDFEVGITQFADLTKEEFIEKHLTLKVPHGKFKRGLSTRSNRTVRHVPEFLDWRTRGAITPVKQQGQCASCWAFSVVGSLETQHFLKHGTLVSLSEQNLIDCSVDEVNSGCSGGWMANAFNYLKSHSISSEKYYPYKGVQETCVSKRTFQVSIQDFHQLAADEMILLESVASVGPIAVAIDASNLQFYAGGVFRDHECVPDRVNHGVLVVGYGVEAGRDYWLVKNSWGESWGEAGYFKIIRNNNNHCNIASYGMHPIL